MCLLQTASIQLHPAKSLPIAIVQCSDIASGTREKLFRDSTTEVEVNRLGFVSLNLSKVQVRIDKKVWYPSTLLNGKRLADILLAIGGKSAYSLNDFSDEDRVVIQERFKGVFANNSGPQIDGKTPIRLSLTYSLKLTSGAQTKSIPLAENVRANPAGPAPNKGLPRLAPTPTMCSAMSIDFSSARTERQFRTESDQIFAAITKRRLELMADYDQSIQKLKSSLFGELGALDPDSLTGDYQNAPSWIKEQVKHSLKGDPDLSNIGAFLDSATMSCSKGNIQLTFVTEKTSGGIEIGTGLNLSTFFDFDFPNR